MKRKWNRVFSFAVVLALCLSGLPVTGQVAQALSTTIVISQIYGGGSNAGAVLRNDFVELFNRGSSPVSLNGMSVQYASATGTGFFNNNPVALLSGTLAPGQYYLVQLAGGTNGAILPTPDASGTANMSGTSGKVALVNSTTGLACNGSTTQPCSATQLALIVDLLGYGSPNFFETAPAPAPSNTNAVFRNNNGCTETDNNSADFTAGTPSPRNTSSPLNACSGGDAAPTVSSTDPAGDTTDVSITTDVTVTFSEPVNVSGNWFQLVCTTSGTRNVGDTVVSGGPITFVINPNADFANSETCTLTVFATQVADQDTNDPDDFMAADYVTSFTTFGPDNAPDVESTVPADGATNVPLNQNVVINFTEPVNVTDPWFSLTCATSGTHSASVTGGPSSFVLNPTADFVYGELCTLVIDATKIADQDNNDPPENMVFNFTAGFTTQPDPCTQPFTPIPAIQGSGATVALPGSGTTTQGIVVGDYEGPSPALRGFFIQDQNGDGDPATSDGIFIFEGSNANTVSLGDLVRVTGTAGENQDQSQISVGTIIKCGTGTVAPTDITFPVSSADFLERYEGMLVRLPQTMYVTEHFQLGRFGQVVLSANARLKQPTNVVTPGAPALALQAQNNLNKIILDDGSQTQNPDPILFARNGLPLSASNTLRGGDTATGIVGLLNYTWAGNAASGNAYRIRPINALGGSVNFVEVNSRPTSAPPVGGTVKVVGMNLLNFFNTFDGSSSNPPYACNLGVGGPLTDCRGADDSGEFARQWPKTVAAILAMNPDVVGFNEIENDGYGPTSAIQFLVDQLNAATAPGTYAFIDADTATGQINALGTDAIKVGMIYKPAVLTPVGQTAVLNSVAFVNGGDGAPRSRPSLAQAFQVSTTGAVFIADINHLKSKGSACDAPDAGDGQGNCSIVRTNSAAELMSWLATNPTGTGDPDILLLGDYNSYAMEDPITLIKNSGFTNLIESFLGIDAYSYVFDGQWGYLDHALGSTSIVSQVTGVADYHINSDEPSVLDYNDDFKSLGQLTSLYAPDQFRISDHDPVLVGLNLTNDPPVASAGGPYSVHEGGTVTLTATGYDPDGTPVTFAWDLNNDGIFETPGQSASFTGVNPPTVYTVNVQVTDATGLSTVASTTIAVLFNFTGFFQPVDNLPALNVVNSGRSIPIKFSLFGDRGLNIFAAGSPSSVRVACDTSVPLDVIEETVTAGSSSLSYSPGNDQYTYVWKTERSWSGTCRLLQVTLSDGTIYTAFFKFVR